MRMVLALAGFAWIFVCSTAQAQQKIDAKPNIVLIISDDHGWTDYGFMGSRDVRTPHIDRLAAEGLTFPRGRVPSSLCCPSLASLITGLYPHQNKITSNDPPKPDGMPQAEFARSKEFLAGREQMSRHLEAVPTLPRVLSTQGYRSLQTGKWWQGDYRRGGFSDGMTQGQRHGDLGLEIGRSTMKPISDFVSKAQADQKPFLIWYAPMLPHSPHNPPERLLARYRKPGVSIHLARYRAMVEWFDETVGDLLKILDQAGASQNTIVVYLADNGWTQSETSPDSVRSKLTPYDAGLRTPIIIRWPEKVAPRRVEDPVSSVDLVPTLLTAVGVPTTAEMQGVNLLNETNRKAREFVFGECFTHNAVDLNQPGRNLLYRWASNGRWKLIAPRDRSKPVELYDVESDPQERKNLATDEPKLVEKFMFQLDRWWKPD